VFAQLVLARIIEPVSKLDSLRVLEEAGVAPPSYATLKRRLRVYAMDAFRHQISAACAAHARLGRASLVLYDVSTLYFETGKGDGFRESGFSKERRLEPQITIGLLADRDGFSLMVSVGATPSRPTSPSCSALAVSRWIERQTGWSIRKFVKTARRYRTIEIQAGSHVITAADPLPGDLRQALDSINGTR
jgi:hypothetical protein